MPATFWVTMVTTKSGRPTPMSVPRSKAGVVKVKFGLAAVDSLLTEGTGGASALRVDVIDRSGQVIASSVSGDRCPASCTGSPSLEQPW